MELVAENGFIVPVPRGCKKELGRGSELAIHDKTVSRHQILLELQEQSKEGSSVDHETYFGGLSVKVLGANPVCIVHIGQSTGRRSKGQEMILLKKGEMDTLFSGDKISLSLRLPMFLTVREGEKRKNIAGVKTNGSSAVVPMEEEMQLAEDDLLGKWKDRRKEKKCITRDTEHADALENRHFLADDVATNEEEAGIAQAVARRQKRALERRQQQEAVEHCQQQEQDVHDKLTGPVKESENVPNVENEGSKQKDIFVNTENIDPVKEFGFLVEGSEFEQYKNRHKPDGGRWVWPPAAKSPAECRSDEDDEDQQEKHTRSSRGKKRADEDDDEWRGDDREEKLAIASAKKPKVGAKVNLRSHEPSSSKKRDNAIKKAVSHSMVKDRRKRLEDEDEDEDEDEADETLGGFIVDDDEEEDDDADDEEDESSDDEEMDEAEEDAQQKKSKNKKEEKPLCKYGKKCYRKNPDHLAQYRH